MFLKSLLFNSLLLALWLGNVRSTEAVIAQVYFFKNHFPPIFTGNLINLHFTRVLKLTRNYLPSFSQPKANSKIAAVFQV